MTKVARGQLLIGTHAAGERNRVFAVTAMSQLQGGDRKAWLHCWDPAEEGDVREREISARVRFPDGVIVAPWRLLDVYDTAAMVGRVDAAMRLLWVEGGMVGMKQPPEHFGLRCLQALFRGPLQGG